MRRPGLTIVVAALALATFAPFAPPAAAQQRPAPRFQPAAVAPRVSASEAGASAGTAQLAIVGTLGGLVGLIAGIPLGNAVDRARGYDSSCKDCTRWGAAAGAAVGTTVGIAAGVHLENQSRGRFPQVLLRTGATMAAGFAASYVGYKVGGEGWDMLGIAAGFGVAVAVAIHTERATMPAGLKAAPTGP